MRLQSLIHKFCLKAFKKPQLMKAFSILFLFLAACDTRISPPTLITSNPNKRSADQESWNIDFSVEQKGLKLLIVKAAYMARFESKLHTDSSYAEMTGDSTNKRVFVQLFDPSGNASTTVEMDKLIYYESSLFFKATGNVLVQTASKKRLESQEITWDNEKRILKAPKLVKITTPSEQFQGYNLTTDEQVKNLSMSNITGQAYVNQ
jgi:hypothetical protein